MNAESFHPDISIISSCHNHGKYIHEMIDSVLKQTFQNFEIIIVNDGSTDNTRIILDGIRHKSIRIIHSDHKGPSFARNLAIRNSKSSIILNLDADDKIEEGLLEKAYDVFRKKPEAGIVYTNCRYFGSKWGFMKAGNYSIENMLISNRIVSAAFFRKEDWEKCGGYSEDFVFGLEDWDLWISIIELGKEVIKIPDSCVYCRSYHDPAHSRSGRRNSDRKLAVESILLIYRRHINLYSLFPAISNRMRKLEVERKSGLIYKMKNFIFPIRYRLSNLVN